LPQEGEGEDGEEEEEEESGGGLLGGGIIFFSKQRDAPVGCWMCMCM
jgi:hypothetical protein